MAFPRDDYTPFGYLDTPTHTRVLRPRGVLRSAGAGFLWHYPAYAGTYGGRREIYRAGMRLVVDGAREIADFEQAASPYHSKDVVAFDLRRGAARAELSYQLVGEHVLALEGVVRGASQVELHVHYARLLGAAAEWGESGLLARVEDGLLVLQGFEDGEAFVLWAAQRWDALQLATSVGVPGAEHAQPEELPWRELPPQGYLPVFGKRGERVALMARVALPSDAVSGASSADGWSVAALLARGKTVPAAREALEQARAVAPVERSAKLRSDEAFWAAAPRLEGDWPAHWRRGLVYDLETVRMMVKQPCGIYQHPWDAMQIHAPRVVLAEAALDALLLAYADPALAQQLLAGTFLDAPEPHVPCSREDGSYNMVAVDGTVCGTAPSWGYPWLVLEWLLDLRPNLVWLGQLYPALVAYLEWWLANRRAPDGSLVYACSWESGQDCSARFGPLPLGCGQPSRQLVPVDLQAAFAHAARVMARCAGLLGRGPGERQHWEALAAEYATRTDQLWNGHRYADYDLEAAAPTSVDDVMLLAPLALGVAPPERAAALREPLGALDPAELTWPMLAWTAVEAAARAGLAEGAAELAAAICERAYGFWDGRELVADRTLPGIACEYWPPSGRCGGEGYGWGAFTTHFVLHILAGITPLSHGLRVAPNLPLAWRVAGRRYVVRLTYAGRPLTLALEPLADGRLALSVDDARHELTWGEMVLVPSS